jgi:hypothetical protein
VFEEIGRQQQSAQALFTEGGKATGQRQNDPDLSAATGRAWTWAIHEFPQRRQFGVGLCDRFEHPEPIAQQSQLGEVGLGSEQRFGTVDSIFRAIEVATVERATRQFQVDLSTQRFVRPSVEQLFEFWRGGTADALEKLCIEQLDLLSETIAKLGVRASVTDFFDQRGPQLTLTPELFDRRLCESDPETLGRALILDRQALQPKGLEQTARRRPTVSPVLELRET